MTADHDDVRVIVVDDNRDEAESLGALLAINGYTVRTTTSTAEVIDEVVRWRPHCVMLDIDMPGMDGIELSRRLRAAADEDLVVIAVTGWGPASQVFSEDFVHIDHCLRKPVDPAQLARLLPPIDR